MLGFMETIELKDELLALEEQLGEFLRDAFEKDDCIEMQTLQPQGT